ncbi:methyltransferase domain-containing protein [Cryobacterium sp. TMT1-66-1]|uniref:methyltransferase domain-containing protein n=1 Tax=Cryobacterium sp. TMT1-66-1 TaxID=1259242 RepID=UPI00106B6A50|nr:methyltransferase domain-containing protein [Cryobacterium sp. TMT1-66-1]TFD09284.1 methyltransferase domain-containing protein [Cryobacterium sp. TMT1-66-1]
MTHLTGSSESAPRDEYTHGHHESVLRSHTWRTVANSAAYLIPELQAGSVLLDVGCGPGTITVDLAHRLAPGRVVGIDASSDIVARATGLAADEGVHNASFQVGDVYALAWPDATFDIVHAHQVLQHLADPVAAMAEIRRVLKPGGVFAARDVDYGGVMIAPNIDGLVDWMRVYREVHAWNGGDPDAGRSLKAWARRAGFTAVTSSASIWCFASDAEREWWGESWAVRVTESSFAAHAIESGLADLADLERMAVGWREWVRDPNGWFGMPHGEILARA